MNKSLISGLQTLDRRYVFLFMVIAVIIPFAFDLSFDEVATPEVQAIFQFIEKLPEGAKVLVPFDFDPPSEPELKPMADSFVRHLCQRKQKIYFMALWPMGQAETLDTVNRVIKQEFPQYIYGKDYVMLGYKPGGPGVIQLLLSNFKESYPIDAMGTPIAEIPMMQDVRKLEDMDLILNVSAGSPGLKEWIQFGSDRAVTPIGGGVTAVMAPLLYPYYPKQLSGLLGGLKAAAEYESLLITTYPKTYSKDPQVFAGIRRMGPQTLAHLVIIFFIVIGNIAYFVTKRKNTD
ncbi:MAG: hypothetical protein MK025_06145 [Acidobacteriia bacterium]|nr:hypothetical protein [Terriglobia bacterium]